MIQRLLFTILMTGFAMIVNPVAHTTAAGDTYVYVCTGPQAEKYHSKPNCRGLNRCSGDIKRITLSEAKKGPWKTPCKVCH